MADVLGITQQDVAKWERDKSEPDSATLKQLSRYFTVSIDYILGNEKNSSPKFNDDETKLLYNYRALNNDGRELLFGIMNSLCVTHSKQNKNNSRIIQSNSGGSNFLVTGGENHSFNVTSV